MVYQLTPALLDAMVLAIAEGEDAYGYMIAQRLKSIASQKESSLYPVLKRLLEAGLLETYDQEYQGRNRRYSVSYTHLSHCIKSIPAAASERP